MQMQTALSKQALQSSWSRLNERAWRRSRNCQQLCLVAAAYRHIKVGSPPLLRMMRGYLEPATWDEWLEWLDALVPRLPTLPWSAKTVSKGQGWTRMQAKVSGRAPPELPQLFNVEQTEKANLPYAFASLVRSLAILSLRGAVRGQATGVATVYGIWQDNNFFYVATEDVGRMSQVARTDPAWGIREQVSTEKWRDITRQYLQILATVHAEGFSQCAGPGPEGSFSLLERFRISEEIKVKLVEVQVTFGNEQALQTESYAVGSALLRLMTRSRPMVLAQPGVQHRADLSQHQTSLPDPERRECRDLLERLMAPSPQHRLSIEDALRHPWCTGH